MNYYSLSGIILSLLVIIVVALRKSIGYRTARIAVISILLIEFLFMYCWGKLCVYETPEEAFSAFYFGRTNVKIVLTGEKSAYVVGFDGNKERYKIVSKSQDGWRVGFSIDDKEDTLFLPDNGTADIFHRKGTNDYYVRVLFVPKGDHIVSDNYHSVFQHAEYNSNVELYYSYIQGVQEDYIIFIDGTACPIKNTD